MEFEVVVFDKLQVKVYMAFFNFFHGGSISMEDYAFIYRGCHALQNYNKNELVEGLDDRRHTCMMVKIVTSKLSHSKTWRGETSTLYGPSASIKVAYPKPLLQSKVFSP
jgi:hypothetical protein